MRLGPPVTVVPVSVSRGAVEVGELVEGEAGPPQDAADRVKTINPTLLTRDVIFRQDKYAATPTSKGGLEIMTEAP